MNEISKDLSSHLHLPPKKTDKKIVKKAKKTFLFSLAYDWDFYKNSYSPRVPLQIKDQGKLEKKLRAIKVDGIYCPGDDKTYIYFKRVDFKRDTYLLKKTKFEKSQFLNKPICKWAPDSFSEMKVAIPFAFMDIEMGYNIQNENYAFPMEVDYLLNNDTYCSELNQQELEELREEVIKGMAHKYKLYLQIKEKKIVSFMKKFLLFMTKNKWGRLITTVKVTKEMIPGVFVNEENKKPSYPSPIIVVYLPLIPGTKEQKNEILKCFISPILKQFKKKSSEITLDIQPRFTLKIKDFLYLTQGNSNTKHTYKAAIAEGKLPRNLIYTQNYVFFKGYTFDLNASKTKKENREKNKEINISPF